MTQLKQLITEAALSRGYSAAMVEAADIAYRRARRQARVPGTFDSAGRFYLSHRCACCEAIRDPSRSHPESELRHGRSAEHVASEFGQPALAVKRLLTLFKAYRNAVVTAMQDEPDLATRMKTELAPWKPNVA